MRAVWITLNEVESKYNVKASTIRSYLNKGLVAKYHYKKSGKIWLINENWIKSKYSLKE